MSEEIQKKQDQYLAEMNRLARQNEGREVEIISGRGPTIGTWKLAGELNNNFHEQAAIGWHILLELSRGAEIVIVRAKPRSRGESWMNRRLRDRPSEARGARLPRPQA